MTRPNFLFAMCFPPPYECTLALGVLAGLLFTGLLKQKLSIFRASYSRVFSKLRAVTPENGGWGEGHTCSPGGPLAAGTALGSCGFTLGSAQAGGEQSTLLCFMLNT